MAGGKATVAEAEAARGQTTINQKAIAIAAVTVLVTAEMVAAIAVAAAMATVAMAAAAMAAAMVAPTGAEAAVDMGRRSSLVHLHNRSYRCDYNCFVYSEYTVFWFLAKNFCFCKTLRVFAKHEVFWQNIKCFHLLGLFVEYTFGRTLIFLRMRLGSQTL